VGRQQSRQTKRPSGFEQCRGYRRREKSQLALKADGTVTAWGSGSLARQNVPAGLSQVIGILPVISTDSR